MIDTILGGKGWKKVFQAYVTKTQAGKVTLICDKIDFKTKWGRRDKESHSIHIGVNIIILNLYVSRTNVPQLIKEILLDVNLWINPNTMKVDSFNISFSPIDRSSQQN